MWEMCGFVVIVAGDGWADENKPPVQLPHLDFLRFVYGRGNTTGVRLRFSFPRFRVPDQVRRCVRGMRVEPRFRGLMARTVLLVYTLFELLGSWF